MTGSFSVTSASITLITSMLGAAINFMPSAFQSIGYLNALLMMVVITFLTIFTLYAISYAVEKQEDKKDINYASLGYRKSYSLGMVVDISTILALCLICLAFFNYIVEMAVLFLTPLNEKDKGYIHYKILVMTTIMIVFYILSLNKDIKSLKYTSYAGVASIIYLILLIILLNIVVGDKLSKGSFMARNTNYYKGISMLLLAMSCQINMVKIYSELKEKTTKSVLMVAMISSIGGGLIYSTVGFFGYRVFGESVEGRDIINIFSDKNSFFNIYFSENHPNLKYLPSIAVIGAMIVLVGSFPLQINPAASTIVKLIGTERDAHKVRVSTITIMCLSIFLINLYPNLNLETILEIIGAVFNNMLSFIFPCIYYIMACRSSKPLYWLALMIILASISCGSFILYNIIATTRR